MGAAGGRRQPDQRKHVIHPFSIKPDCLRIFCFLFGKKKGRRVPRCLTIFFSNTVSWGGFSSLVLTPPSRKYPQCNTWSVILFDHRPLNVFYFVCGCARARVCVCSEKCTNQIRYKFYSMPLFSLCWKKLYIHRHCSSLSVSVRSLCLKWNLFKENIIYICLVSVSSEEEF